MNTAFDVMTKEELLAESANINKFITRVFNYYNGKINVFNNQARLDIEWMDLLDRSTGAISMNPDIVVVYPSITHRFCHTRYWFYYNTIVSIIHELFHIDQIICYPNMLKPMYNMSIEAPVELNTYMYMAGHQRELLQQFNFTDVVAFDTYYDTIKDQFDLGYQYHRRNYKTHMICILQDMLYVDKHPFIDKFIEIFDNPESVIDISIGDDIIRLKDKLLCCPLKQLNDFLYDRYFKYNFRGSDADITRHTNDLTVISFKVGCVNKLYTLRRDR